jgi:hypothetical protein
VMGAPQQMAEVGVAWPRRRCPWQTAGARCGDSDDDVDAVDDDLVVVRC